MHTPLVSVLTTAYNREAFIAESIESVLSSTFTDFELIVVDDGSKDNTVAIAKKYEKLDRRVKVYVNEKNLGDYLNRNRAASYATGQFIKYLDSDDYLYPHGLQVMVYSMEKFPEAGFGVCSKEDDYFNPLPVCISPRQIYLEHFNGYHHFFRAPGSAIINKAAFDKVGGFTGKRYIGDIELWLTLAQQYAMVKFQGGLYCSRDHNDSEGASENKSEAERLRKNLIQSYLLSPYCPINREEVTGSYKYQLKKKLKKLFKN